MRLAAIYIWTFEKKLKYLELLDVMCNMHLLMLNGIYQYEMLNI